VSSDRGTCPIIKDERYMRVHLAQCSDCYNSGPLGSVYTDQFLY